MQLRGLSSRSACATQLRIAWTVGSNCLPSADNNTAVHELTPPESVRCEPARPSGAGRPAEPAPVKTGSGLDFGIVDTSSPTRHSRNQTPVGEDHRRFVEDFTDRGPKGQVSTKSRQLQFRRTHRQKFRLTGAQREDRTPVSAQDALRPAESPPPRARRSSTRRRRGRGSAPAGCTAGARSPRSRAARRGG